LLFSIHILAHECRNIPLEPIPTRMMCELQGDATREDTTLHAAIARLDYLSRVFSEEVAHSTTLPTKVVTPEGVAVVGSNTRWPKLSPSATIFTTAHHPRQRPALETPRTITTASCGAEGGDGPAPLRLPQVSSDGGGAVWSQRR